MTKGAGYPLPAGDAYQPELKCVKVWVPDLPEYHRALTGALDYFASWLAWERDPAHRGRDAARSWREANELTVEHLDDPCIEDDQVIIIEDGQNIHIHCEGTDNMAGCVTINIYCTDGVSINPPPGTIDPGEYPFGPPWDNFPAGYKLVRPTTFNVYHGATGTTEWGTMVIDLSQPDVYYWFGENDVDNNEDWRILWNIPPTIGQLAGVLFRWSVAQNIDGAISFDGVIPFVALDPLECPKKVGYYAPAHTELGQWMQSLVLSGYLDETANIADPLANLHQATGECDVGPWSGVFAGVYYVFTDPLV